MSTRMSSAPSIARDREDFRTSVSLNWVAQPFIFPIGIAGQIIILEGLGCSLRLPASPRYETPTLREPYGEPLRVTSRLLRSREVREADAKIRLTVFVQIGVVVHFASA